MSHLINFNFLHFKNQNGQHQQQIDAEYDRDRQRLRRKHALGNSGSQSTDHGPGHPHDDFLGVFEDLNPLEGSVLDEHHRLDTQREIDSLEGHLFLQMHREKRKALVSGDIFKPKILTIQHL